MIRPDWHERAACRGAGTEQFYISVPGDPAPYHARLDLAVAYCKACPVITDCAQAATQQRERFGVWAGQDRTRRSASRTRKTAA